MTEKELLIQRLAKESWEYKWKNIDSIGTFQVIGTDRCSFCEECHAICKKCLLPEEMCNFKNTGLYWQMYYIMEKYEEHPVDFDTTKFDELLTKFKDKMKQLMEKGKLGNCNLRNENHDKKE